MKFQIVAATFFITSTLTSGTSWAESICYDVVESSTSTTNITSTLQTGQIKLKLVRAGTSDVVFNKTGTLVGVITGTLPDGRPILTHTAKFSEGFSYTTQGDVATPMSDPTQCSFAAIEFISHIARGTKLFDNLQPYFDETVYNGVVATGEISNCPDLNRNTFSLAGRLCKP